MGGPETWRAKSGPKLRNDHGSDVCHMHTALPVRGFGGFDSSMGRSQPRKVFPIATMSTPSLSRTVSSIGKHQMSRPTMFGVPQSPLLLGVRPQSRETLFSSTSSSAYGDWYWPRPHASTQLASSMPFGPYDTASTHVGGAAFGSSSVSSAMLSSASRPTDFEYGGPQTHWSVARAPFQRAATSGRFS